MTETLLRAGLFALYQITLVAGIALMPLALLARRAGVTLPIGRLIETVGRAYESVDAR